MANVAVSNTFTGGTKAKASEVNTNFSDLVTWLNGRNGGTAWDALTSGAAVSITPTTNQLVLGSTRTVTISAPTPATSSRTHTIPDITADGTFAFLEGTQTFTGAKTFSGGAAIKGTTTNDDATALYVGESVLGQLARSSATGQTASTTTNVTSISLTAGDWDISGAINWRTAATTTAFYAGINTTSATLGAGDSYAAGDPATTIVQEGISIASAKDFTLVIPSYRIKLSSTTTFYLVQQSDGASNKPNGFIEARRRR